MARREVRCPICKNMVSLRGFSGHLRFTHKLSSKAASKITSKSKEKADLEEDLSMEKSNMSNYKRVLSQIDKLDGVRQRRMEANSLGTARARGPVLRALARAEEELEIEFVNFSTGE